MQPKSSWTILSDQMKGRVFKSTGSWYGVLAADGNYYRCRLRGKFKQDDLKINNPIAVGDYVTIDQKGEEAGAAVITEILPRENYIIRKSTRKSKFAHILASNIDLALVLATITFPRTSQGFIDRFLVSAESFRIPAKVIINKKDLYKKKDLEKAERLIALYNELGYECLLISANDKNDIAKIKTLLEGKTTLISGHSGVGKSTMLNGIAPHLNLKTGEVSSFANKGTHTTTFAEMFEIAQETYIIDTPGIKELGLFDLSETEISHYFPEMRTFLGQCKFNNCMHINEPQCRVIQALEDGEIDESRYLSYLSILEDHDSHR